MTQNGKSRKDRVWLRGFTLIEASMLLFIGGLVMASSLQLAKLEHARKVLDVNQERMMAIKKALAGYAGKQNRLPCPARRDLPSTDGAYGQAIANCATGGAVSGTDRMKEAGPPGWIRVGAVPVVDLGLPKKYMTDSWGRLYTYALTEDLTVAPLNIALASVKVTSSPAGAFPLVSNALYVLVSHGADGKGAYTTQGQPTSIPCPSNATGTGYDFENCRHTNANAVFTRARFSTRMAVTQHFDDIITWSTTVNDLVLPVCDPVTGTLHSTDGVNFTCQDHNPPPPTCGPGQRLTSNDGVNFTCQNTPYAPIPSCPSGHGLARDPADPLKFVCQAPPTPIPPPPYPAIPSCPAGYALISTNGSTLTCKDVNIKSTTVNCDAAYIGPANWSGCTATCPVGTTVTGGGFRTGTVYSDQGRVLTRSGNGYFCKYNADACSSGSLPTCTGGCTAGCAYIQ